MTHDIRPFTVKLPQADLQDLRRRLEQTRWADSTTPGETAYGFSLARLQSLVQYWLETFDWRAIEARLNSYPQFLTEIGGQAIHFIHVRSGIPEAVPLILTHGWPGSILEYLDLIDPLTHPAEGGQAFDLVIPSLPGFGFSGPVHDAGWDTRRTANAWAELMSRLGYQRYGAVGNDAGSMISPDIARVAAEHVIGVHVTQLFSFPSGTAHEMDDLSAEDQAGLEAMSWFWENKGAFNTLHSQQPQTLAHAISDSPAGLLAWNAQLLDDTLDDEFVIANVALYWLTHTAGSSIRLYYEDAHHHTPHEPTAVPVGLAAASAGDFVSIRRFAERDHHITSWHTMAEVTGHYSAHTHPAALAQDVQTFFANL